MKRFLKKYRHLWILSYGFIYLPWFIHLEKTVTDRYHVIHAALDDRIPFNEYFIIPYLLWFVYVAGAITYFFFVNREDYYRLCIFLFTGMTISLLICTLFPNGTDFRPVVDPDKNLCSRIVSILYRTDTCTNVFPSVHVYNSIGTHIAIMKSEELRSRRAVRISSFVLMISICLATVFLKQHSVIDGVASALLSASIYPLAYAGCAQGREKTRPEFIR